MPHPSPLRRRTVPALSLGLLALAALGGCAPRPAPAAAPAPPVPSTPAAPAPPATTAPPQHPAMHEEREPRLPFDQAGAIAALEKAIAGREQEPAEKVFLDIRLMQGVPAGRLLKVMEGGFSRGLGVQCRFCHDPAHWEADTEHKGISRNMIRMTRAINEESLAKMPDLDPDPRINCTTCHRGERKPALDLPEAPPAQR